MEIKLTPRRPSRHYSDGSMSSRKLPPVALAWSMSPKTPAKAQSPAVVGSEPAKAVLPVPMIRARSLR
jgi:hypothetical protein